MYDEAGGYIDDRFATTKLRALDLLKCPLCRQTFNDPRSLPCGDAFCLRCLQRHVDELQSCSPSLRLGSFGCPTCSSPIGIPERGVSAFPRDQQTNKIQESVVDELAKKIAARIGRNASRDAEDEEEMDESEYSDILRRSHNRPRPVSSILERIRSGNSSFREGSASGLRYSRSFTGGAAEAARSRVRRRSNIHEEDEDRHTATDYTDPSELISPVIGRNRNWYSSLRERYRRSDICDGYSNSFDSQSHTNEPDSNVYSRYSSRPTSATTCQHTDYKDHLSNLKTNCDSYIPSEPVELRNRKSSEIRSNRSSLIDTKIFEDPDQTPESIQEYVQRELSKNRGFVRAGSLREPRHRTFLDVLKNEEEREDMGRRTIWEDKRERETQQSNNTEALKFKDSIKRSQSDVFGNNQTVLSDEKVTEDRSDSLSNHIGLKVTKSKKLLEISGDHIPEAARSNVQEKFKWDADDLSNKEKFIRDGLARKGGRRKRAPITADTFKSKDVSSNIEIVNQNSGTVSEILESWKTDTTNENNRNILMEDNDNKTFERVPSCTNNSESELTVTEAQTEFKVGKHTDDKHDTLLSEENTSDQTFNNIDPSVSKIPHENSADVKKESYDEIITDIFDDFLKPHESDVRADKTDEDSAIGDNITENSDTMSAVSEVEENGSSDFIASSLNTSNDSDSNIAVTVECENTEEAMQNFDFLEDVDIVNGEKNNIPAHNDDENITKENCRQDELLVEECYIKENNKNESEQSSKITDSGKNTSNQPNIHATGETNSRRPSDDKPSSNILSFRRSRVDAGSPINTGTAVLKEIRGGDCVAPTAVASMKNVKIVADYEGSKLVFNYDDGSPTHSTTNIKPFCLAVSRNQERLFVGDRKNKTVCVFDEYGSDVAQWDSNIFPWISGMGLLRNGNLAILDRSKCKVGIYTPSGELLNEFGSYGALDSQICLAEFLAVDSEDRILISDSGNHCIKVFSTSGKLIDIYGQGRGSADGDLQWPKGICVNNKDDIIIADCCNNRVSKFSKEGVFIEHLVTNIRYPYNVSCSRDFEGLFVTLQAMNRTNNLYHVYSIV